MKICKQSRLVVLPEYLLRLLRPKLVNEIEDLFGVMVSKLEVVRSWSRSNNFFY